VRRVAQIIVKQNFDIIGVHVLIYGEIRLLSLLSLLSLLLLVVVVVPVVVVVVLINSFMHEGNWRMEFISWDVAECRSG
jgi:hypothetical protein